MRGERWAADAAGADHADAGTDGASKGTNNAVKGTDGASKGTNHATGCDTASRLCKPAGGSGPVPVQMGAEGCAHMELIVTKMSCWIAGNLQSQHGMAADAVCLLRHVAL